MYTSAQLKLIEKAIGKKLRAKTATIHVDGKPEFPMPDKKHARLALDFINDAPAKDRAKIRKSAKRMLDETIGTSIAGLTRPGLEFPKKKGRKINLTSESIGDSFERVGVKVIESASTDNDGKTYATVVLIEAGPGNKVHKHWYSNELLEKAVSEGKFEGRQCYVNHPDPVQARLRPERDAKELLGFFKNARIQYENAQGSVVGFKTGEKRAMVVADFYPEIGQEFIMEKLRTAKLYNQMFPGSPGYIGWSIVAGGSSEPRSFGSDGMWKAVTEFTEIDSIDLVTRAGAGGRLLTFMEANMPGRKGLFGLFRGQRMAENQSDAEKLRGQLSEHVLESLKKAGVNATSAQSQLVEAGLAILPKELLTPGFIMTAVAEAGIDVPQDKEQELAEALGLSDDGKLSKLCESIQEAKAADEEESDMDEADDEDPEDQKDGGKDEDTEEDDKKKKESLAKVKDPATRQILESIMKENVSLRTKLNESEKARKDAEKQAGKSVSQLREVNAKQLLAKSKLTEAQREAIFEEIAGLPTGDQAKKVKMFETLFAVGTSDSVRVGPARNLREAASGTTTINALRD